MVQYLCLLRSDVLCLLERLKMSAKSFPTVSVQVLIGPPCFNSSHQRVFPVTKDVSNLVMSDGERPISSEGGAL